MISTVRDFMLAKLKTLTDVRVVAEGENFKPKSMTDYPFAKFQLVPRETIVDEIFNPIENQNGLARIDLFFSRSLNSADAIVALGEVIKQGYPQSTPISTESNQLIIWESWIESLRHDEVALQLPIFVRWSNYAR